MGKQTLRDIGRDHMSKEQRVMAEEMSRPKLAQGGVERSPHSLSAVMDSVVGRSKASPEVEALALQIINTGPELRLGMKEWRAVQDLVEAGIVAGRAMVSPSPR